MKKNIKDMLEDLGFKLTDCIGIYVGNQIEIQRKPHVIYIQERVDQLELLDRHPHLFDDDGYNSPLFDATPANLAKALMNYSYYRGDEDRTNEIRRALRIDDE